MVMEVVHEDIGDGNLQCTNHPYKTTDAPGGICALCLQEKLGKLVSSSFPMTVFPSSSSSPSPSFRSDFDTAAAGGGPSRPTFAPTSKSRNDFVFKRSKSTAGPRRRRNRGMHFLDETFDNKYDSSPNKKGFWSFLYTSKRNNKKLGEKGFGKDSSFSSTVGGGSVSSVSGVAGLSRSSDKVDENGNGNGNESPVLDRKVSRSRSVGCGGSRSFSGDFFERISTGFGDCTLRRVESHREGKSKVQQQSASPSVHRQQQEECMIKERVRCGGIFSGFMITTSSSSSSSSLISEETNKNNYNNNNSNVRVNRKSSINNNNLCHGRSKSWGWALASPMKAFSNKQSGKRDAAKHATPNLSAIPSLLAVRS